MEENKDKKREDSGKLQLKKTFNVGQIKQSFSHGRTRSVSVEVKKKRVLRGLGDEAGLTKKLFKEENDHEKISTDEKLDSQNQKDLEKNNSNIKTDSTDKSNNIKQKEKTIQPDKKKFKKI